MISKVRTGIALARCIAEAKANRVRTRWTKAYQPRVVLFHPFAPHPFTAIYKMCHRAGYRFCFDRERQWDIGIYWNIATRRLRLQLATAPGRKILNAECLDVGKKHLSSLFADVFGYAIVINPALYEGSCVRKSDENATHDGEILACPIDQPLPGSVYQRLINNSIDPKLVEDLRLPFICNHIPFIYRKLRPKSYRFSNVNVDVTCHDPSVFFSKEELAKISDFCNRLGMEYGELDVLRDRENHRLYVVDANPTPWGPPNHIRAPDRELALRSMTDAFVETVSRYSNFG